MNGDDNMDKIVQDHEQRLIQNEHEIKELKANQTEFTNQMRDLKYNQEHTQNSVIKLENSVLKANGEQKELLNKLIDNMIDTNKENRVNEFDLQKSEHELKKEAQKNRWDLTLKIVQSGGILFLLVEYFIR
ncbi:hypothetical protein FZC79_10515 [Rossellomorea vietnamensis]|uniref:Uncharacterized protein n=1 Tax=Rossellomorea vietnamensis TaxID=218284 RepID=A0A5D4KE13_9BACI|nr:hypothetical protein [Rossellomorea vietnamensis]TYR75591.1 hypothetical protein FZC79_10515 [Rossellomorea vietnamensis]